MKVFILVGEPSGDLHGSHLAKALYQENPNIDIVGWGGILMKKSGVTLSRDLSHLSFMGFAEILKNLPTIFKNFSIFKKILVQENIKHLILIDYPGFNLRAAKWAKKRGIQVIYFISPKVWAWKENRTKIIKNYVDKLFCILPFEKDFYAQRGVEVQYIGNPLIDVVKNHQTPENFASSILKFKNFVALLPGSRVQEIERIFPIMLNVVIQNPSINFVVAATSSLNSTIYQMHLDNLSPSVLNRIQIIEDQTYSVLKNAYAAIVTSGTATLEACLHFIPQIVCYNTSKVNYFIGSKLVNIKFISLVNLIAQKEVVKELIQNECNPHQINEELTKLLSDVQYRNRILSDYKFINESLGNEGIYTRLAQQIIKLL